MSQRKVTFERKNLTENEKIKVHFRKSNRVDARYTNWIADSCPRTILSQYRIKIQSALRIHQFCYDRLRQRLCMHSLRLSCLYTPPSVNSHLLLARGKSVSAACALAPLKRQSGSTIFHSRSDFDPFKFKYLAAFTLLFSGGREVWNGTEGKKEEPRASSCKRS